MTSPEPDIDARTRDPTRLERGLGPRAAAHPGKSGVYPLLDSHDAFAARYLLARAAERTLDVQYYIWHPDMSGTLLFGALRDAAERGVRVRLLLDDNNTAGLDRTLAALHAHPNIEVRLFNPFRIRRPRWIGYLTDFSRLNRRMHNKSFTADRQATIIGGRNIGDEYFEAAEGRVFVDLDVLAVGPVVADVSADFERYWHSPASWPLERLVAPAAPAALVELAARAAQVERSPAAAAFVRAVRESPFVQELIEGRLELDWAPTRMVSDDPAKACGLDTEAAQLPYQLTQIVGEPRATLDLVSAYFVPTAVGVEQLAGLARRAVAIRVLTNSLEATDVQVVHAGYARRRRALLEAGVALYELRRISRAPRRRRQRRNLAGPGRPRLGAGSSGSAPGSGSSISSLHAKTFSVDGCRVFIGSYNFDPRSARLNTEMGFVIESANLARAIKAALDSRLPGDAYEVRLTADGRLYWLERGEGKVVRHDTEPGASLGQRVWVWLLSRLPIEWLL